MSGSCGVWELRCLGVAVYGIAVSGILVCGSCGMWDLRYVGVLVCGSCGMWELQCEGLRCEWVMVLGSQGVKGCGVEESL